MQKHHFANCCICDDGKPAQITCGGMHHWLKGFRYLYIFYHPQAISHPKTNLFGMFRLF